jgi:hypothetical protein
MKKLLMAILVLCITPLCPAPMEWSILPDEEKHLTVSVIDPCEEDIFLILAVDSGGVLSSFAKGSDAPSDSFSAGTLILNDYDLHFGYLGQGELWLMADWSLPFTYDDGNWLTADFDFAPGKTSSVISLYFLDMDGEPGDEVLVAPHVIPEPITLCLLGFGGLFLCRRK